MSTATTYTHLPSANRGTHGEGWARRLWNHIIAARQAEANQCIARHLNSMGDQTLRDLNLSDANIATLRQGGVLADEDGRHAA